MHKKIIILFSNEMKNDFMNLLIESIIIENEIEFY